MISNNVDKTPVKGRPKRKGFKGTPKKKKIEEAQNVNFVIEAIARDQTKPLGLINDGENMCFFNSVIQVLYSVQPFQEYVHQMETSDPAALAIKDIFSEIESSNNPIKTSTYIQNLQLHDYIFCQQYDAQECLLQLVGKIFHIPCNAPVPEDCPFKLSLLQSILCGTPNCNFTSDNHVSAVECPVKFEDPYCFYTTSNMIERLIGDHHGESMYDFRCEVCQQVGSCKKVISLVDFSDFVILHLNTLKFRNGRCEKMIPNLQIDEEVLTPWAKLTLHAIVYHSGNANSGHYTAGIKMNETWFLVDDKFVSNKVKFTCTPRDSSTPYLLIYKKSSDVVTYMTSINDVSYENTSSSPTTETISMDLKPKNNGCMSEFTDLNPIYLSVKKHINTIEFDSAETLNKQSLMKELDTQKERIMNAEKKKDVNCDDNSRKTKSPLIKRKRNYTDLTKINKAEKERLKKYRKNLDNDAKDKLNEANKEQMKNYRQKNKNERLEAFKDVEGMSMVDPSILATPAYKILKEDFEAAIKEGPTYTCDICYKCEYRTNVIKLVPSKYEMEIFDKCHRGKYEWICKSCHNSLTKNKMPMQAQANNLELCQKFKVLEDLCPIELMLISQIIPFMFIVAKHKGAQHGLKGQCVLVPADLKKIQTVLPRSCNEEYLICLALKRRLSDTSVVNKQNIRPAFVNRALQKLVEINPFYKDIRIDRTWENISERSDPELWKLLTDENAKPQNVETDSDDEIEGNDHAHEKEKRMSSVPYPTVLHNIDGPNISADEIVNIAPGEGQIPVSVISEPDWEALAFPKHYSTGNNHFNESREVCITPSKYIHARLKCCDDRFASDPQYIFHALDWIERNAVASSINFAERKQFQSEISAGQLVSSDNVRRMISDDQIFASFKNIRGTPQYFHNMMLDVLAKVRQFGVTTFFLTFSAAEFHWPEIIKIVAYQYGETLTTEQVNGLDWNTKVKYLKRNPVTVARQIDYIFRQVFGKIIYSGMHPIGQILNHDDRREFQSRGAEHVHASIHVFDAPKIDENEDSEIEEFIDKYITCSLPDENEYPELNSLVKSVQTHHHTSTCRKKKGIKCRFNAPWPPYEKTRIVRGGVDDQVKLKESKKIVDKVLSEITSALDLSDVTLEDILESCDLSETEYSDALECVQKKASIIYKRRPCEKDISPYNTVILSLLKSNMNIQFVMGVYGLLTYLTSYLCKPEHTMSELMKKASKEASGKDIKEKLRSIGNVFITKREVSTHEAIKRALSLPMRTSNIDTIYIDTGIKKNRTRILKSQSVLQTMDPEDNNVYATNIIDKYANRPDVLEQICYADFATNYISKKVDEVQVESEDIKNYTMPVSAIDEVERSSNIIVLKKELGEMRKRSRPCVMRYHKVSKMKDSEQYYLKLLQLYMPWRNEDEIKGYCHSYEEKFGQVE